MEKLIELLSEYTNKHPLCIRMSEPYKGVYLQYDENFTVDIISKQFGFIKRLVDSDKINRDKVKRESKKNFVGDLEPRTPRYKLLILLSISDNPIEDLISYLK